MSKLNNDLINEICKLIEAGNYARHAALSVGITEQTFYNWINRGERSKSGIYFEFFESIKKSRAKAIVRNVAIVNKAAQDGDWKAAMTWLERTEPDLYGRKERIEHSSDKDSPLMIEFVVKDNKKEKKRD